MVKGFFWNPTRPDHVYRGRIKIKGGAPWLYLVGRDDDMDVYASFERAAVVFGRDNDGAPLTLWHTAPEENYLLNRPSRDDEMTGWKQAFAYLIRGAHIEAPGGELYRQSSVSFQHLDLWARHPDVIPADQESRPAFEEATLANVYDSGADARVTIENAAVIERSADGSESFRRFLGDDARIVFTFDKPQPLLMHQHLAFNARDLITFCYQRAAVLTTQTLSFEPASDEFSYTYRQDGKKQAARTHPTQMTLTPATLRPSVLFPKWWQATHELYPVPQILAGRYYTKRAYIEGHVLAAVASAEKLYTLLGMPSTRFEKDFFELRRREHSNMEKQRELKTQAQKDFRAFLSEVLKNQPTFEMKLRALADRAGTDQLAAADIDVDLWVKKVKDVRNKLAHEGSHVDSLTGDDTEDWLGRVDNSTRVVLSLILRDWLGAPPLPHKFTRRVFPGRGTQHEPNGTP